MQPFIALAAAAAAFLAVYIRRKSFILSFLFSFSLFLSVLFLLNYELIIKYRKAMKETVCLLIDKSLSAAPFNPAGNTIPDNIKVFYFADTVSENTNALNNQYTALYDSLNYLKIKYGTNTKIAVISDFNDNYSYKPLEKLPEIYPLVQRHTGQTPPDTLSLTGVQLREIIQSGQKENIKINIYSKIDQQAGLRLSDNGKLLETVSFRVKKGGNEMILPVKPGRPGFHIYSFAAAGKEDLNTNNNSAVKAADVLPEFYRLLFISGKPSAEYAFIRRFLTGLKWIKTDTILLKEKSSRIGFPACRDYNGIILLDLKDSQFSDLKELTNAVNSQKPVFYEPGLNEYFEMKRLLGLFAVGPVMENFTEKKFAYGGEELVVKTALDVRDLLIEPLPRARVFFGFDAWKWDFSRLGEDLSYNAFTLFWQNTINFLIGDKDRGLVFEKLNYVTGENNPSGFTKPGIYRIATNGREMLLSVSGNPAETGALEENLDIAAQYNSNFIYLDRVTNLAGYLNSLQTGKTVYQNAQAEIDFRNNVPVLLLIVLSLAAFWILKDYIEIRS